MRAEQPPRPARGLRPWRRRRGLRDGGRWPQGWPQGLHLPADQDLDHPTPYALRGGLPYPQARLAEVLRSLLLNPVAEEKVTRSKVSVSSSVEGGGWCSIHAQGSLSGEMLADDLSGELLGGVGYGRPCVGEQSSEQTTTGASSSFSGSQARTLRRPPRGVGWM